MFFSHVPYPTLRNVLTSPLKITAISPLSAPADARLAVDCAMHDAKANGTLAEKGFKLGTPVLGPCGTRTFSKRQAFREMTTRVHFAGSHVLELQVNGVRCAPIEFWSLRTPRVDLTRP